ncbi:MAG: transposase [Candidatus Omnitrophica bacterium]|nr:transposase [Candidatus Omnitrophota bacterium]
MIYRKDPLVNEEVYHVFSKSIAGFKIFNNYFDYERMIGEIAFYREKDVSCRFSEHLKTEKKHGSKLQISVGGEKIVEIIAYCLMPTHLHFILKQLREKGISQFMGLILNSFTRYFNSRYKRKGPLWEGRFKNVLVKDDAQFVHLTRYLHLNPTSSGLVDSPEDWKYSSYKEYLGLVDDKEKICNFSEYIDMPAEKYKEFVMDRMDYQRELTKLKKLVFE